MKKIIYLFLCCCLVTIIACSGGSESSQSTDHKKRVEVAFGPYKVGEKFVNQGYEGHILHEINKHAYRASLDSFDITTMTLLVTSQGTIAAIEKSYELPEGLREFVNMLAYKLNINFRGGGTSYNYHDANIDITVSMKNNLYRWIPQLNDFSGIAEVAVIDKQAYAQLERDIKQQEYKKALTFQL